MNKGMILTILGLGGAYFFLSSRTPVWVLGPTGTYVPSGMLDQLTVMLTGAQPPQSKSGAVTSAVTTGLTALANALNSPPAMSQSTQVTTPGYSGLGEYFDQSYSPGVVPRIYGNQRR